MAGLLAASTLSMTHLCRRSAEAFSERPRSTKTVDTTRLRARFEVAIGMRDLFLPHRRMVTETATQRVHTTQNARSVFRGFGAVRATTATSVDGLRPRKRRSRVCLRSVTTLPTSASLPAIASTPASASARMFAAANHTLSVCPSSSRIAEDKMGSTVRSLRSPMRFDQ